MPLTRVRISSRSRSSRHRDQDRRTQRAEGVERLRRREGAVPLLQVARRHVAGAGDAEHRGARLRRRGAAQPVAEHQRDLAFELDARALRRQHDRAAGPTTDDGALRKINGSSASGCRARRRGRDSCGRRRRSCPARAAPGAPRRRSEIPPQPHRAPEAPRRDRRRERVREQHAQLIEASPAAKNLRDRCGRGSRAKSYRSTMGAGATEGD